MKPLITLGLLFASAVQAPYAFSESDYFHAQVAQCVEDHRDRGPLAPDISTTCATDAECENAEEYCFRAIASGCSDPDDYSYSTCEGVR